MAVEALKFFISYNRADKEWARWIAWRLEATDHEAADQAWDIQAGEDFILEMQRVAKETDPPLAALPPSHSNVEFPLSEWTAALRQDPRGAKRRFDPDRRECKWGGI